MKNEKNPKSKKTASFQLKLNFFNRQSETSFEIKYKKTNFYIKPSFEKEELCFSCKKSYFYSIHTSMLKLNKCMICIKADTFDRKRRFLFGYFVEKQKCQVCSSVKSDFFYFIHSLCFKLTIPNSEFHTVTNYICQDCSWVFNNNFHCIICKSLLSYTQVHNVCITCQDEVFHCGKCKECDISYCLSCVGFKFSNKACFYHDKDNSEIKKVTSNHSISKINTQNKDLNQMLISYFSLNNKKQVEKEKEVEVLSICSLCFHNNNIEYKCKSCDFSICNICYDIQNNQILSYKILLSHNSILIQNLNITSLPYGILINESIEEVFSFKKVLISKFHIKPIFFKNTFFKSANNSSIGSITSKETVLKLTKLNIYGFYDKISNFINLVLNTNSKFNIKSIKIQNDITISTMIIHDNLLILGSKCGKMSIIELNFLLDVHYSDSNILFFKFYKDHKVLNKQISYISSISKNEILISSYDSSFALIIMKVNGEDNENTYFSYLKNIEKTIVLQSRGSIIGYDENNNILCLLYISYIKSIQLVNTFNYNSKLHNIDYKINDICRIDDTTFFVLTNSMLFVHIFNKEKTYISVQVKMNYLKIEFLYGKYFILISENPDKDKMEVIDYDQLEID